MSPLVSIVCFLGNGTLNKHAGIDYKQLSLLAKINENQSGEVLLVYTFFIVLNIHNTSNQVKKCHSLHFFCIYFSSAAMARALARK